MPDYGDLSYALAGYGRKRSPFEEQRKFAYNLLQSGMDTSPIQSPWQGAARLAQALTGGLLANSADTSEKEADQTRTDALAKAMAEPDPQKRMAALAVYDPEAGARAAGQWAVEQAKLNQQQGDIARRADNYGIPAPASGMPAPLPNGQAPATPAGFANNSGNIRSTGPGNYNGFATYGSPQEGANAQFGNFQAYVNQNPNITVAQALAKWAPPNENNTAAYIKSISEATGINPGMPLSEVLKDPATAAILLDAQTRLEKGGLPQGFTPDTFTNATRPPGQPTPLNITVTPSPVGAGAGVAPGGPPNAPQPQAYLPQGEPGTPPAPNPQGVSGPAVVAAPQPPQRLSVDQAPPEILAPFVQRLRTGAYGYGPDAEIKMRTEAQAALDRAYDTAKLAYEQKLGDYTANRNQAIQQPQQNVQNESKMREQLDNLQTIKDYRKSSAIFSNAITAAKDPTAAGDLNLVYAFATMMDPGSVVREGEMGMVKATQNASDQVKALVNMVSGGQRISPEARAALLDQMNNRYQSLKGQHDELMKTFGDIAERGGMDRRNIAIPIPEVKYDRKGAGAPPPPPGFRPVSP